MDYLEKLLKDERELANKVQADTAIRILRLNKTVAIEMHEIVDGEFVHLKTMFLDLEKAMRLGSDLIEAAGGLN